MKKIIISILAIAILVFTGYTTMVNAEGEIPQIMFISGIKSGVCLIPNVNLWNKPGGILAGAKVMSTIKGRDGLSVKVIEIRLVGPRVWYHVKTFGINDGKSGWLIDSLIKHYY